jgi:hypothetical protein
MDRERRGRRDNNNECLAYRVNTPPRNVSRCGRSIDYYFFVLAARRLLFLHAMALQSFAIVKVTSDREKLHVDSLRDLSSRRRRNRKGFMQFYFVRRNLKGNFACCFISK